MTIHAIPLKSTKDQYILYIGERDYPTPSYKVALPLYIPTWIRSLARFDTCNTKEEEQQQ